MRTPARAGPTLTRAHCGLAGTAVAPSSGPGRAEPRLSGFICEGNGAVSGPNCGLVRCRVRNECARPAYSPPPSAVVAPRNYFYGLASIGLRNSSHYCRTPLWGRERRAKWSQCSRSYSPRFTDVECRGLTLRWRCGVAPTIHNGLSYAARDSFRPAARNARNRSKRRSIALHVRLAFAFSRT